MYSELGRPSIPPEKLLRAQLLQMLYSVRSERLLMEEIDYSVLFRWFVGMDMDEPVWDPTVFTKNRDRLLKHEVAKVFFVQVCAARHDSCRQGLRHQSCSRVPPDERHTACIAEHQSRGWQCH